MRSMVSPHRRISLAFALAAVLSLTAAQAQAQSGDTHRNNPKVLKLFRTVVAGPSYSTVRVQCDGEDAALGAVVGADGWILTKASDLHGKIVCRFRDGKKYPAKVVGVEDDFDLAMLKIDATGLKPVEWEDSKAAKVGRWVAAVAPREDPAAIGIISVGTRGFKLGDQLPKTVVTNGGWLGVGLDDAEGGARVTLLLDGSPAKKAGLKKDDIITHINRKKVAGRAAMIARVQHIKPGTKITIDLLRDEEEMTITVTLGTRPFNMMDRRDQQDSLGSELSTRRGGFPKILQHDAIIKPVDCGGPLVDLDGKVVGINIARAGRTESFAIPSDAVQKLLEPLMTGKLPPPAEETEDAPSIKRPR